MKKSCKLQNWLRVAMGVLMLFAVLTVGLDAFAITSHAESAGKVTASSAKIRKEPSTSSETVGSAAQDAVVSVKGQTTGSDGYTWYQVSVDAGTTGYIRSDLMEITDGSTPSSLVTPSSTTSTAASTPTTSTPDETLVEVTEVEPVSASVTGGSPVRVRQNASTTSRIVSTAQSGLALTVTGTATGTDGKDWYQVNYTSGSSAVSGFIRADYVSVSGDLVPAGQSVEVPETSKQPETVDPEPEETKDWDTYYEEGKWHLLDNQTGNAYDIDQIFASVEANSKTLNETLKTNKTQQIIVIILVIVLVVMAGVISFLIFKLKDMADSAYFEEVERETVRRRTADRPVERPQSRQRVMQTVGAENKRPVSQRPAGQRSAEQRPASQRPAGTNGGAQRPAGANGSAQRPAGANGNGQRPASQRPAGTNGSSQRPVGANGGAQRPAGTNGSAQRPAGANGSAQRPAGANGNGQRPAGQRPAEQRPASAASGRGPVEASGGAQRPEAEQEFVQREAQQNYMQEPVQEYEPAYEQDVVPEVQMPEEIPAQPQEKPGRKSRNFADDDEFEFQFLDWDGEEQK